MTPKRNNSNNNRVCNNAHTRARVRDGAAAKPPRTHTLSFSDGELVELAEGCGVPLAFAKERLAEWKRSGWTTTQGKQITRESLAAFLVSWWKNEKNPERYETPKAKPPRKFTAADWALCAERCAHCTGNGCGKGIATPPDKGQWQKPPQECNHFAAIADNQNTKAKGIK